MFKVIFKIKTIIKGDYDEKIISFMFFTFIGFFICRM
jgi:hypothetical protein